MKRTDLVLDEQLLARAVKEFGVRIYSAAVNLALSEALRARKVAGPAAFQGSILRAGDLSEIREDRRQRGRRKSA